MSKLIFTIFALILVTAATLVAHTPQRALASQAWGKSRGDVAVRIIEREASFGQVRLMGEVQTVFDDVQIEWKLPEGVTIVEGSQTDVLHRQGSSDVLRTSAITLNVPQELPKPHVVFYAYTDHNGHRAGHSRVFNLKRTEEQKQHVESIKQMMIQNRAAVRE